MYRRDFRLLFLPFVMLGLFGSSFGQLRTSSKKVELDGFSFYSPRELVSKPAKGIDTTEWAFESYDIRLSVSLGRYSGKPAVYAKKPNYREKHIKIDGRRASLVFFRDPSSPFENFNYAAAIYFERLNDTGLKLSFFAYCRNASQLATAGTIFRSIKFDNK
jgi:hypothetical protein